MYLCKIYEYIKILGNTAWKTIQNIQSIVIFNICEGEKKIESLFKPHFFHIHKNLILQKISVYPNWKVIKHDDFSFFVLTIETKRYQWYSMTLIILHFHALDYKTCLNFIDSLQRNKNVVQSNEQYRNLCYIYLFNIFYRRLIVVSKKASINFNVLFSRYKNRLDWIVKSDWRTRRIDRAKERPTNDGKNVMINKSEVRERRN